MTAREAGFTTRGSCLLAAGLTASVCGVVLGETDLVRAGILAAALPLVALLTSAGRRSELDVRRLTLRQRVTAGQPLRTAIQVTNRSRLPTTALQAEESAGDTTASSRFSIESLTGHETRVVPYVVTGLPRGRHLLGPVLLSTGDVLGLRTCHQRVDAPLEVLVVPAVEPLVSAGSVEIAPAGAARALGSTGTDDASTREYQVGDDLRRVHWRSTARTGSLMVRQEARNDQGRLGLLLAAAPAGRNDATTAGTEWAVGAAASIGVHWLTHRQRLSLAHDLSAPAARQLEDPDTLLDVLAEHGRSPRHESGFHGTQGAAQLLGQLQADVQVRSVCAVLGRLDHTGLQGLCAAPRWRSRPLEHAALLVDVGSWGEAPGEVTPADAAAALQQVGWHVVVAGRGTSLAQVWAGLGARAGAPR